MFCPNCGGEINDGALFCSNCGYSRNGSIKKSARNQNGSVFDSILRFIRRVIILCIILIVVGLALGITYIIKFDGDVDDIKNFNYKKIISNVKAGFTDKTLVESDLSSEKVEETETSYAITETETQQVQADIRIILNNQINAVNDISFYNNDSSIDMMNAVTFGSYAKSEIAGANFEPLEWIVLEKQNGKALLLSKYIIDCMPYEKNAYEIVWENSSLRNWLNNDFLNAAFTAEEKNLILQTNCYNQGSTVQSIGGGNNTLDYLFCPSVDEMRKYFGEGERESYGFKLGIKAASYGTKFANKRGNGIEASSYWLRTPGQNYHHAMYVRNDGKLNLSGMEINTQYGFVRPMLWVSYQ